MTTTAVRGDVDLETTLRDLNADIARVEGELSAAHEHEEELVERHREAGTLTEQSAVREMHAAAERSSELERRLNDLREQRERVRARMHQLSGQAARGGLLALSFDRGEIDQLRQAALRRTSYSIRAGAAGHATAVDLFEVPLLPPGRHLVEFAVEQFRVADLVPQVPVEAGQVAYLEETVAATAAAPVPVGEEKPESSPTFVKRTAEPQVIAHWTRVPNQVLADIQGALDIIGSSLLRGLVSAENQQLLAGDGQGAAQVGFLDGSSGVGTISRGTSEARLDLILRAATAVRTGAFTDVTALVLHPRDYLLARTERSAGGSEEYLAGSALDAAAQNLWGIPTYLSTDIPQGTGLVGNFAEGARLFVREAPRIDVGLTEDDFARNMTSLRCEERVWLAITRPACFKAISFA